MSKIKLSTINYAAKQCYQLHLMRGIDKSTNCGLHCQFFYSETLGQAFILVTVEGKIVAVKVRKSWREF